jgi:hypothetical protein
MAELTMSMIQKAHSAFDGSGPGIYDKLRAAAPFLQLPWDEPIKEEIDRACDDCDAGGDNFRSTLEYLIKEFVRRRNAVIHPKPVDPRVDEIALIICQSRDAGLSIQQTAAKIAALDEVK